MDQYAVVTTIPIVPRRGPLIPANTVINIIKWDGIVPYTPNPNTILVQSNTLQVGDTYSA